MNALHCGVHVCRGSTPLPAIRISALATAAVLLLLACSSTPAAEQAAADSAPDAVPELTLNLPEQPQDCTCLAEEGVDYTFLDKGFKALVAGDHIEAVQYFQRYQRLESSPQSNWEAGIAIAYDSMLPASPFYDPAAARKSCSMGRLRRFPPTSTGMASSRCSPRHRYRRSSTPRSGRC